MRSLLCCLMLAVPAVVRAQGDCFPAKDSHEAQVFGIFSVPIAFAPGGAPAPLAAWHVRAGVETSYLPNIDDSTATPTTCRPGKGPENVDFGPLLPRPRMSLGLPGGFALEASYIPPVRVKGAKPSIFGVALTRTFALGGMTLGLRGHATVGVIHAPIVCDDAALKDPISECFNGTKSNEEFHPNIFGADASVGWTLGGGRFQPYLGGGFNVLHPRFRVNFTNQFGQVDRRRVEVDLQRAVLFAGASWFPGTRFAISGQIYSAPTDAVTGRVAVSVGL
ncbi:MAG TPA: hypothetical protein VGP80_06485 [Gemmatimonadales bacterium]|jgi:hypothetical protein|nr:hypothetical protein [Gemmatimonadales bacterium]